LVVFAAFLLISLFPVDGPCGPRLQKCALAPNLQACPQTGRRGAAQPRCGIEITCTDGYVQVGYSDGICFRASSPGIWAILHRRVDQASFRRRLITYRQYHFQGYWDLKARGTLESGPFPMRELFLVLPDDLIEFRLADPDCPAKVEIRNFGYVKKGRVCELRKWLARHRYLANVQEDLPAARRARGPRSWGCAPPWENPSPGGILSTLFSLGNRLGLSGPWVP
jgi:hypothetical protein